MRHSRSAGYCNRLKSINNFVAESICSLVRFDLEDPGGWGVSQHVVVLNIKRLVVAG